MTDYFALLHEPRRPWLDPEVLKARFLALSAPVHPDRVHGEGETRRQAANERFTALNSAFTCLSRPPDRLAHLIELERGMRSADIQEVPPDTMELFLEVSRVCRETDALLSEKACIDSPVLLVGIFERGLERGAEVQALLARLDVRLDALLTELRTMNPVWEVAPPAATLARQASLPLARLEQMQRLFSYFGRWTGQLRERATRLVL